MPAPPPDVEAWQRVRWQRDEPCARCERPRKGAEKHFLRDLDIHEIVGLVVRIWGVTATRNPESNVRQSACDIVAEALGMSYEAVASIHNRHPKSPVKRRRTVNADPPCDAGAEPNGAVSGATAAARVTVTV